MRAISAASAADMTEPPDPSFAARVRASFARQSFMTTLSAKIETVEAGHVVIRLPFRADLMQQHGLLHAGAVTAIVDSACGYAALPLMPPGGGGLSVAFKMNTLGPAAG